MNVWHKTWASSSDSSSRQPSSEHFHCVDDKKDLEDIFSFPDSLKLAQDLQERQDNEQIDVCDLIDKYYSHLDMNKFVPRDDQGVLLSLGSVWHLMNPQGSFCKPCGFYRKNKCYRLQKCLYCHFDHAEGSYSTGYRTQTKAKARRERRKRLANAAQVQDEEDDADIAPQMLPQEVQQQPTPPERQTRRPTISL